MNPAVQRAIDLIVREGITAAEAGRRTGIAPTTIRYHLDRAKGAPPLRIKGEQLTLDTDPLQEVADLVS